MAKQRGEILLDGKLGGLSFYNSKYGRIVRQIVPVSKERLAKDPAFARRRDNMSEFGYGSREGKLMRRGVSICCPNAEVGDTNTRLAALIKKTLVRDTVGARGKRRLTAENVKLLKGFNWKESYELDKVLRKDHPVVLDLSSGAASMSIAALVPATDVKAEAGATHVELMLALVAVDFEHNSQLNACGRSGMIALAGKDAMVIDLSCAVSDFGGKILVAGVGVQGYQLVGGEMVPLMERAVFEIGAAGVG